jgi:hypothetical protein
MYSISVNTVTYQTDRMYRLNVRTTKNSLQTWIELRRVKHRPKSLIIAGDTWQLVETKKNSGHTHYWQVVGHNLFDENEDYLLYFIDPDVNKIDNIDPNNHVATDSQQRTHIIYYHLSCDNTKMTPTCFVAIDIRQIIGALRHVCYCVVKMVDNELKIIR